MRRKDQCTGACAASANRVHIPVKGVKLGMWQPSFVKMQRVQQISKQLFNHFNVVHHPIISALRDGQDPWPHEWILLEHLTCKRVGFNLAANVFWLKFIPWNG